MRGSNEYDGGINLGSGYGQGQPIIAPTFLSAPTQPYAAPGFIGNNGGVFGGEGGLLGLIAGAALLGGRGFGGRDGGCDNGDVTSSIFGATVLGKLGDISGAIPLAASNIQNGLLEQTIGLNSTINQTSLAQLAATSGVKDAVQNSATALLLNNAQNTQSVLTAIAGIGTKIDQNRISELETELSEQRSNGRTRDLEINVIQNATQLQAQQQAQAQIGSLFGVVSNLANDLQTIKQGQVIFNSGTMAASGTQAAANTKVA